MKYIYILGSLLATVALLEARMMDMTHILNKDAQHGQIFRNFSLVLTYNGTFSQGASWFKANDVLMAEHTGTHMDAPVHCNPKGKYIHELPKEQLVGPAVVFDVLEQAKTDRDYALRVSDIEDYERTYGRIPDGAIAFISTGGSDLYHDPKRYLGTDTTWIFETIHYPGFGAEAANWLVRERKIKGLGSDRLSFDVGHPPNLPVHDIIGKNDIFGLENVANVHKIPAHGATVVVLPMPVEGGTGFPTRIMAFWGNNNELIFSKGSNIGASAILMGVGISLILTLTRM